MKPGKTTIDANIAESLKDIGERLKILRLQQDLALNTISKKTNIPIKHLESLESGNLANLPELIYVRGFIRRYAQELHQDVESFDLGRGQIGVWSAPTTLRRSIEVGELFQKLKYPLYAFMVFSIGSGLVYLNKQDFSPTPTQSVIEVPVVSQSNQ